MVSGPIGPRTSCSRAAGFRSLDDDLTALTRGAKVAPYVRQLLETAAAVPEAPEESDDEKHDEKDPKPSRHDYLLSGYGSLALSPPESASHF